MIDRSKRNSKNFRKRYDWNVIQKFYDDGNSWGDIVKTFGVSSQAVQKAKIRGDLVLRNKTDAQKLAITKYGPSRMGVDARKRLSIEQSTKNRGGKSKWYNVAGQLVQGTWERDLALKMEELSIKWTKLKTGKDVWPYVIEGTLKHYTPDFYLPEFDVYLDPKGFWWGNDKQKIEAVKAQHTDKKLIIVEKELYNKLLLSDVTDFVKLLNEVI